MFCCDPESESGPQSVTVSLPPHSPPSRLLLAAALSYTRISLSSPSKPSPMRQPYPPARPSRPCTPLRLLLCTITTRSEGLLLAVCWPRRTDSRNSRTAFRSDTRLLGRVV